MPHRHPWPFVVSAAAFVVIAGAVAIALLRGGSSSVAATPVAGVTPVSSAASATELATYSDPFAYCAAVGDQLHPDNRYTGPAEPQSVVRALERALGSKPGTLDNFAASGNVYWRCEDSHVLGCFPGANLTCWDANTDRTPTDGEIQWCASHPGDGGATAAIPFVVTGHSTVYEWRCVGTTPTVMQQVAKVDKAGLIARIWYTLSPN